MSSEVDHSVAGDDDSWLLFERTTPDGHPLVVLARAGNALVEASLRNAIITVVECVPDGSLIDERGMPRHTDRIYPVEERLARELQTSNPRSLFVASVTGDGLRRLVFTHTESLDFERLLTALDVDGYALRAKQVDDRDYWTMLVTPTDVDRQLDGDIKVISRLEEDGDDGSVPRKTDFWFYGDPAALRKLSEELGPWGLAIDHWLTDPDGVVLTSNIPTNYDSFSTITPMLVDAAARHGVTYDGWETCVVGPDSRQKASAQSDKVSPLSRLFGARKN